MSEIDSYRHECMGIVLCPSTWPIVPGNDRHRNIPLYRLDEDALTGDSFQAKRGDLLLGGGSGESAALRIAMPQALDFATSADRAAFVADAALARAFWSMNDAFRFCDGYARLGWTPDIPIEEWLTDHILAFIIREYPDVYGPLCGPLPLARDGSICRLPTPEETRVW